MKTEIPALSYDSMFKAVFNKNNYFLCALIKSITDYYHLDIIVNKDNLILKNVELPIDNKNDKRMVCDFRVAVDKEHEVAIEINRSKKPGLTERNIAYSFKLFTENFRVGDPYSKLRNYMFIQVNFDDFFNEDKELISDLGIANRKNPKFNRFKQFNILKIDIASCLKLVYNKSNLDEISDLVLFGAILHCKYLEDISSILERGFKYMPKDEKDKFIKDIKTAASDEEVLRDVFFERTFEDRIAIVEGATRYETTEQVTKDVTDKVTKENTEKMIKAMLDKGLSYQDISDISKYSIDQIKKIANEDNK